MTAQTRATATADGVDRRGRPRSPPARCGPTPGATTSGWCGGPGGLRRGGRRASMEAIAKQAGVGVGTLYRHFPKRIDVVEAVYRNDVDELVDRSRAGRRRARAVAGRGRRGSRRSCGTPGQADVPQRAARGIREEPGLGSASRERIEGALARAGPGPGGRRGPHRRRRPDLMQLLGPMCTSATLTTGAERAAARDDPGRPASTGLDHEPLSGAASSPLAARRPGRRRWCDRCRPRDHRPRRQPGPERRRSGWPMS